MTNDKATSDDVCRPCSGIHCECEPEGQATRADRKCCCGARCACGERCGCPERCGCA
jgi:hypothetical protein